MHRCGPVHAVVEPPGENVALNETGFVEATMATARWSRYAHCITAFHSGVGLKQMHGSKHPIAAPAEMKGTKAVGSNWLWNPSMLDSGLTTLVCVRHIAAKK